MFKAKLGLGRLGAVLLTLSYHSDSKMGHKLASSGCMKNLGLVFPGTALAPS